MENDELGAFQLILHSGNARSSAYEALGLIKSGRKEEGLAVYKVAREEILLAQRIHSDFLHKSVNENCQSISLLLVHAEDHISSSQVIVELVKEIMEIHERIGVGFEK